MAKGKPKAPGFRLTVRETPRGRPGRRGSLALYGIGKGNDLFARQCLLARRLVEAGVRFVEITAPAGWDHHALVRQQLPKSCAAIDAGVGGLLADLKRRCLLQDTFVIWGGEFGRTSYAPGLDGRDHNHKRFSLWMADGRNLVLTETGGAGVASFRMADGGYRFSVVSFSAL